MKRRYREHFSYWVIQRILQFLWTVWTVLRVLSVGFGVENRECKFSESETRCVTQRKYVTKMWHFFLLKRNSTVWAFVKKLVCVILNKNVWLSQNSLNLIQKNVICNTLKQKFFKLTNKMKYFFKNVSFQTFWKANVCWFCGQRWTFSRDFHISKGARSTLYVPCPPAGRIPRRPVSERKAK